MLLRLLFVLLIALNIAVAAWLLLGESGSHAVEATDSGVPRLKLLAEVTPASGGTAAPAGTTTSMGVAAVVSGTAARAPAGSPGPASSSASTTAAAVPEKSTAVALPAVPAPAPAPVAASKPPATPPSAVAQATLPDANAPTSPRRSYRCLAVGPFASQVDLHAARTAIAARTVRSRQRQEQTSESHGFRVYLPAQATRDLALAQARRLEAKGIKDYFVVTVAGEMQNSVALGLFHDPANARKRRDEVIAAGFPARMSERLETIPVWWLDVVVPDDATADVRRNLRNPAISARPTGCF